jgi:predicted pyridoxine 5'-phosphate oxidase superfamily flavin-nucleotide-binding protein
MACDETCGDKKADGKDYVFTKIELELRVKPGPDAPAQFRAECIRVIDEVIEDTRSNLLGTASLVVFGTSDHTGRRSVVATPA